MKLRIFILLALIGATSAWADPTPRQVEAMRTEAEMTYFSVESVRKAYNDFCKTAGYDKARYGALVAELEKACAPGSGVSDERKIALKREILLSNPLLDNAKIIVVIIFKIYADFYSNSTSFIV